MKLLDLQTKLTELKINHEVIFPSKYSSDQNKATVYTRIYENAELQNMGFIPGEITGALYKVVEIE